MNWKDKLSALKVDLPAGEEMPVMAQEEITRLQSAVLRVELDKRNGKPATIVSEFDGSDEELKKMAQLLKIKCGSGGSQRDGEILIQGDFRVKIAEILQHAGYKVKKINFK